MPNIESSLLDFRTLDTLALQQTPIHSIDPRAKLLVALLFIVTSISFPRYEVIRLLPLLVYPVALMILAHLPLRFFVGKLLLASPFVLAIAIVNPLLDRTVLTQWGTLRISGGWISFASILLRFSLTLTAALILVATTGFDRICTALARLRVPRPFTVQLLLLYRYGFVLAGESSRILGAWRLRAIHLRAVPPRIFGSMLGQLLLRALDRSQRVHMAMLGRGFNGTIPQVQSLHFTRGDALFVTGWAAFFGLIRFSNLPLFMGQMVTRLVH